jgi:hypothetical protein
MVERILTVILLPHVNTEVRIQIATHLHLASMGEPIPIVIHHQLANTEVRIQTVTRRLRVRMVAHILTVILHPHANMVELTRSVTLLRLVLVARSGLGLSVLVHRVNSGMENNAFHRRRV